MPLRLGELAKPASEATAAFSAGSFAPSAAVRDSGSDRLAVAACAAWASAALDAPMPTHVEPGQGLCAAWASAALVALKLAPPNNSVFRVVLGKPAPYSAANPSADLPVLTSRAAARRGLGRRRQLRLNQQLRAHGQGFG